MFQAFRATNFFHRHSKPFSPFMCSEPPFSLVGLQSHSFRCLELSIPILGVQSHLFPFRHLDPFPLVWHLESFISVYAFRATILDVQSHLFQFRCLEPFLSVLGFQSHDFRRSESSLTVQAFRAISLSLGVQSHIYFGLGVQSHLFQFRRLEPPLSLIGIQSQSFRCSEPSLLVQALEP